MKSSPPRNNRWPFGCDNRMTFIQIMKMFLTRLFSHIVKLALGRDCLHCACGLPNSHGREIRFKTKKTNSIVCFWTDRQRVRELTAKCNDVTIFVCHPTAIMAHWKWQILVSYVGIIVHHGFSCRYMPYKTITHILFKLSPYERIAGSEAKAPIKKFQIKFQLSN